MTDFVLSKKERSNLACLSAQKGEKDEGTKVFIWLKMNADVRISCFFSFWPRWIVTGACGIYF